jgi:hypothetical protein
VLGLLLLLLQLLLQLLRCLLAAWATQRQTWVLQGCQMRLCRCPAPVLLRCDLLLLVLLRDAAACGMLWG